MKIICTPQEYRDLNDVIVAGCCWIGSGEGKKLSNGKKCFFTHGRAADILKVSQTMGMSAVQGHYHTKFVISYWANPDDIFFGMNVGCLINQKSMAFSYAKNFRTRFIIGCGVILNGIPRLLPMVLDKNGNWIGEIV